MPRSPKKTEKDTTYAVALIGPDGKATVIPDSDTRFRRLAVAVSSQFASQRYSPSMEENPYFGGATPMSRLTGSKNLRQLLLPRETDFDDILNRIDYYRKTVPWVNRALILRSAFNASEINVQAPNKEEQTKWMQKLSRDLKFFSYAREWFWQLRAHGQVITLWKTEPGGFKPYSIECADLKAHQPRGPGHPPRLVVLPHKVPELQKIAQDLKSGDAKKKQRAQERAKRYAPPLIEAIASPSSRPVEVPAEELAPHGYHLDYTALDRRHYEDCAFPGMYSIFGDFEMVEMAKAVDINALAQYKAAILLIRMGPENPRVEDIPVMPSPGQLKNLEATIMQQVRNALPTLIGRGDIRISFVTPPIEVFTREKYKESIANIFDWIGLPKVFWAGQELAGAFAIAQAALKVLQQESKDERDLFREQHEYWFYDISEASNAFEDAEWPVVGFDPNSLTEPRLILDTAKFIWQVGASESQVFDALGLDPKVQATLVNEYNRFLKSLKPPVEFAPRSPNPPQGIKLPSLGGRPTTVDQPTPERDMAPQPRPSNVTRGTIEDLDLG